MELQLFLLWVAGYEQHFSLLSATFFTVAGVCHWVFGRNATFFTVSCSFRGPAAAANCNFFYCKLQIWRWRSAMACFSAWKQLFSASVTPAFLPDAGLMQLFLLSGRRPARGFSGWIATFFTVFFSLLGSLNSLPSVFFWLNTRVFTVRGSFSDK